MSSSVTSDESVYNDETDGEAPRGDHSVALAEFAAEVRRLREARGLSLVDLGALSDLSPNYIGRVENGHTVPKLSAITALARGLRVSPGELFGKTRSLSGKAREFGGLVDDLSEDMQTATIAILRAVGGEQ